MIPYIAAPWIRHGHIISLKLFPQPSSGLQVGLVGAFPEHPHLGHPGADTTGLIVKHHQAMRFIKKHPNKTKTSTEVCLSIAWWLSFNPSEKYIEVVSWEYIIPNIWEDKSHVPNHQHTKKNSVPSVSPSFPLSDDAAGSPSLPE